MTQWGLDTLFNPAKRHMDEEKRRLQSTREEVGDSSGGRRIDLESGKVSIAKSTSDADAESAGKTAAGDGEAATKLPAKSPTKSPAKSPAKPPADESPARARARARRARNQP